MPLEYLIPGAMIAIVVGGGLLLMRMMSNKTS
jgi:hypothetical protein